MSNKLVKQSWARREFIFKSAAQRAIACKYVCKSGINTIIYWLAQQLNTYNQCWRCRWPQYIHTYILRYIVIYLGAANRKRNCNSCEFWLLWASADRCCGMKLVHFSKMWQHTTTHTHTHTHFSPALSPSLCARCQ